MEPNASNLHPHCVEITMEVHKVVPPPHRSTFQKFKTRLKETFFPDDPLRQFKGQPPKRKWILGAQYVFPILQWGPNYSLKLFKSDIVSGLTIASLAIPQVFLIHFISFSCFSSIYTYSFHFSTSLIWVLRQGISYAKLANLPPIVGLCEHSFCFQIKLSYF